MVVFISMFCIADMKLLFLFPSVAFVFLYYAGGYNSQRILTKSIFDYYCNNILNIYCIFWHDTFLHLLHLQYETN